MSPDILLFISDQHAPQYQAGGQMPVDTPNLAALRGQGTAFDAAYTPCPLCVPARMAMLSGWLRTIPAFLPITIPCLKQRPLSCMRWQLPGTKPCWWAGCTLSAPTSATALPAVWPRILPTADGCAHKKRWNRISACIPRRWAINGALMWSAAALRRCVL